MRAISKWTDIKSVLSCSCKLQAMVMTSLTWIIRMRSQPGVRIPSWLVVVVIELTCSKKRRKRVSPMENEHPKTSLLKTKMMCIYIYVNLAPVGTQIICTTEKMAAADQW